MRTITLSGITLFLIFCAFMPLSAQANYAKEARQHDFEYYFPAVNGEKTFDNLDAANTYINEALAKFSQSSGKTREKGGGATLNGPVQNIRNVRVVYYITAFGRNGENILTDKTVDIQKEVRNAVGASLVFLIFTNKKSACYSGWYLKSGWRFSSNNRRKDFTVNGNRYTADYNAGWNVNKVYDYLKE